MICSGPESLGASGDLLLDSALRKSASLLAVAQAFAIGLDELGAIDLPPVLSGQVDQAQLRAIASLYLASDLEAAGVLSSVETLAGVSKGGAAMPVNIDLGGAGPMIADFWHHRNDRPTADERGQAFGRLFGDGFENRMVDVCEALYKLDELATNANYGGIAQQARLRQAAGQLAGGLVSGSGGITAFLAQEIMGSLKQALTILGHADLKGAFGARDVWGTVAGIDRMTRQIRPDPRPYVRRGRAGMTVLAWLADAAPHLEDASALLVGLDHPVIPAAVDWMEAALAIGEADGSAPAPALKSPAAKAPAVASPWAAIAA
jgi:hypothetical protein